jgi:hypothetical protein
MRSAYTVVLLGSVTYWMFSLRSPETPDDSGAVDITFQIDESQKCDRISPLIYGTNNYSHPDNFPFRRLGGEGWPAYN